MAIFRHGWFGRSCDGRGNFSVQGGIHQESSCVQAEEIRLLLGYKIIAHVPQEEVMMEKLCSNLYWYVKGVKRELES